MGRMKGEGLINKCDKELASNGRASESHDDLAFSSSFEQCCRRVYP